MLLSLISSLILVWLRSRSDSISIPVLERKVCGEFSDVKICSWVSWREDGSASSLDHTELGRWM